MLNRSRSQVSTSNRSPFDDDDVVETYREATGLSRAEAELFEAHIRPGTRVLDLGVGAGRTIPALAASALGYVGLDLSESMVRAARTSHPGLDLRVGDACDLADFDDGSFDAVVFSFNGIDYLHPDADRHRCLAEVARVLRPGGTLIFSSHDPMAVISRPDIERGPRRAAVATLQTACRIVERVPTAAFWRGDGYVIDRVPPGLRTHMARPARVVRETEAFGFVHLRTVPGVAGKGGRLSTSWWYYAFDRLDPGSCPANVR